MTLQAPLLSPRLLSVRELASYLSVSYAAARALVVYDQLPRVELPAVGNRHGQPMRRLLVDRQDVDAYIDKFKRRPETIGATPVGGVDTYAPPRIYIRRASRRVKLAKARRGDSAVTGT